MTASKIVCPVCATQMEIDHRGETEIDVCPGCNGIWLDGGELEQIVGMPVAPEVAGTQYRKCPHCLRPMKRVVLGGVHLEQCALCEGFFLDAGELKQIAGKFKKPAPRVAPPAPPSGEPVRDLVCQKCDRRFPREKLYAVPQGFLCDGCSGFVGPDPEPGPVEKFLWKLIEGLSTGHHRHHHHHFHLFDDW
ncbi:MAG: zf-TFIIB domain-containing protein [Myxococcales bacterium]